MADGRRSHNSSILEKKKSLNGNCLLGKTGVLLRVMKQIILCVCAVGLSAFSLQADVVEWRGEGRKGIYPGEGLLQEWSDGEPKLLWCAEGIGTGYSSPIILADGIYTTANGTAENEGKELLVAMDKSGKILWKTPYGTLSGNTQQYTGTRSTPTFAGGRFYVVSSSGEASCIDKKGTLLWSVNAAEEYKGVSGRWAWGTSALVADGKVIFTIGGNEGTLLALDAETGKKVWLSSPLEGTAAYVAPTIIEKGGKKQIVGMNAWFIFGVNPGTGEYEWKVDLRETPELYEGVRIKDITAVTPVLEGNLLVSSIGYNIGTFAIRLNDALNEAKLEWFNKDLDSQHHGIVVTKDTVWGMSARGNFCALDLQTGKTRYCEKLCKGMIIAAGESFYCYDEKEGKVFLVEMNTTQLTKRGEFTMTAGAQQHWAHPVIDSDILYIRHGDALAAYSLK